MKILKKGKRRLALLISLCLAWSLGCYAMSRDHVLYNAYAETGQLSDGTLLYRQSSSMAALIVTGSVQECSGDIVIPVSWSGMNIIEIADEAFSGQTEITGVTVPDTVQRIGAGAFRGCTSLEQVNLENTIQSVGAGAFEDTAWSAAHADDEMMILDELVLISVSDSAEKIYVPDSVRVIADEACMDNTSLKTAVMTEYTGYIGKKSFSGCTGLTEAIFPNGVKSIGDHAFADSMLTRAVIPATVLSVGKSAFLHCTALEQVTLWDGILRIGSNAFSSCTSLKQVTVPDSVTELGSSAFKQCTNLQQVSLGIHVTEIQDYTFQDCTSLSVVSMGSQVKRIGVFSFNKCTALQSITLPDGLVQIGSKAFQSCMSLAGINIPESVLDIGTNAFFDTMFYNDLRAVSSDSSFVVYNGTVLLEYYGEDTIVNVPSGIRVIGGSAFGSNETIETIVLPSSIISLSSYAFENLWTMEQITGMEYLQYVGVYAFVDCISLQTLDLNAVLGTVPEGAAMGCEGLVSVNIDDGITGIEEDAFRFSGLASVLIP
ncbi:MAG: leucine-rich repeat protein, partial [Oscillospiraceae bacterium]|nr:leucine-rich repeat protein [Oscillospiraceae bacterium]